jgi:glycosyltransferase involved in cell wall biosynthesis
MATLMIWHGYLLGGTGSNIYSANIAAAWVRAGHRVVLMCQDPSPERYDWVHEVHDVHGGTVTNVMHVTPGGADARTRAGLGACIVVRADIGGVLPVYVLDRYAGWNVRRVTEMSDAELEEWGLGYQSAIAGVIDREHPIGVLLNHLVPVPALLRGTFESRGVPYVIKVHGSELEYAMAQQADRWRGQAQLALEGAAAVLVGSAHIARRTCDLVGMQVQRVHEIPPGVDLDLFAPADDRPGVEQQLIAELEQREATSAGRDAGAAGALEQVLKSETDPTQRARAIAQLHGTWQERDVDRGVVAAVQRLHLADHAAPTIIFVGKFIRQKGAHLLLAALPLVRRVVPDVRCLMVGFGPQREGLEALVSLLDSGDMEGFAALAAHGAMLDDGPDEPFEQVMNMLTSWDAPELDSYARSARGLRQAVTFTGLVDHAVLGRLWPLCTVSVVPSVLPEAFGMVSAEAASCGCIPVVSHHSGLATVADALEAAQRVDGPAVHSFDVHAPDAVQQLADRLIRACVLEDAARASVASACRSTVARLWSWDSIAERVARSMTS